MSHKICWKCGYPQKKKSATGLVIFLLFKKGTNLSGYPKQKIFVFKVCANIVVTTTRKLQMVITSVQVVAYVSKFAGKIIKG